MEHKRLKNIAFLAVLILSLPAFASPGRAARAETAKKTKSAKTNPASPPAQKQIPGTFFLDVSSREQAGPETRVPFDSGIYSVLADSDSIWVGRRGGVRQYNKQTGKWKFYRSKGCNGVEAIAMAKTGAKLWALFAPDSAPCVLDTATGQWQKPAGWKIRDHIFGGSAMQSAGGLLYVNGQGSPDSEGISALDPAREEWLKLFPAKPSSSFSVQPDAIWAGVSEGILRIDRKSGAYRYYLAPEHGCGGAVTAVLATPAGMFFGTKTTRGGELGIAMNVFKNGFAVMARKQSGRYNYRWFYFNRSERKKLDRAMAEGAIMPNMEKNPGGICLWNGSSWEKISAGADQADNEITALAEHGGKLYAGSARGTAIIDIATRKITGSIPGAAAPAFISADNSHIWIATRKSIFRIPNRTAPK